MSEADGGKGRLDWIGGSQVPPMLRRRVIEREEDFPILPQAFTGLVVLGRVFCQKLIEGRLSSSSRLSHLDFLDVLLGF